MAKAKLSWYSRREMVTWLVIFLWGVPLDLQLLLPSMLRSFQPKTINHQTLLLTSEEQNEGIYLKFHEITRSRLTSSVTRNKQKSIKKNYITDSKNSHSQILNSTSYN